MYPFFPPPRHWFTWWEWLIIAIVAVIYAWALRHGV